MLGAPGRRASSRRTHRSRRGMTGPSHALTGYVPALARRQLLQPGGPFADASVERTPAEVMMADIAGFGSLAENLASRGPAGVEQLSGLLNGFFGQLIGIVDAHGGDVLRF